MVSVWSSSSRQRSTSASSISSTSSKSPLATASLVKGHNLSADSVARASPMAGTLKVYPFWDLDLFAGMPPGPIHYQEHAFVLADCHLPGKLIECHREELGVYRRQNQPVDLTALGPNEAVKIGPLVAPLEPSNGPLAHRRPYSPHHRL